MAAKKIILYLSAGFGICALMFGLVSIGSVPKKTVVIVQMFQGPEADAMMPAAAYWNETFFESTGIEIQVIVLNRTGYFDKLEIQLMSGMAEPDIIHPFSLHMGALHPHLEPLNRYLEDSAIMTSPDEERLRLDSLLPAALRTVQGKDDILYMLPKDMSEIILFYRSDLISRPPDTWDTFLNTAKTMTRSINPSSPTRYGAMVQGKYEMWTFSAALGKIWSHGSQLIRDSVEGFEGERESLLRSLRLYEQMASYGILPRETVNAEYGEVSEMFRQGTVAMVIQWNALYHVLSDKKRSPLVQGKFSIAPPPGVRMSDGSISRSMYYHTICLATNRKSLKKKEAARFLTWVTLGEGAIIYARAGGSSPVKSVWENEYQAEYYGEVKKWIDLYGVTPAHHPQLKALMMSGAGWVQRVIAGDINSNDAEQGLRNDFSQFINQ
jgi:multiple sugar transport system substrate-binding protein